MSAVEHADDRHGPCIDVDGIGDQGASFVIGDAKGRADVFARHAAQWKKRQAFTGFDHRAGVALGDRRRPALGDEEEEFFELVDRLWRVDDAEGDQALVGAFLITFSCAAASRALTAPTATARDGSAFSLS